MLDLYELILVAHFSDFLSSVKDKYVEIKSIINAMFICFEPPF
jgi:hypothetical protein